MIMTLTRDIDNVTCHTQGLDTWHFYFYFQKIKKKLKEIKKNKKNQTRGTSLTILVNSV